VKDLSEVESALSPRREGLGGGEKRKARSRGGAALGGGVAYCPAKKKGGEFSDRVIGVRGPE